MLQAPHKMWETSKTVRTSMYFGFYDYALGKRIRETANQHLNVVQDHYKEVHKVDLKSEI